MTNRPNSKATDSLEPFDTNGKIPVTEIPDEPYNAEYVSSLSTRNPARRKIFTLQEIQSISPRILFFALFMMIIGIRFNLTWLGLSGAIVAVLLSLQIILPAGISWIDHYLTASERRTLIAIPALVIALAGLAKYLGIYDRIGVWLNTFSYDEFGSWAEWVGALGQIMIAVLAVYVAWEQYVISKDLTIQQNRITQQQTIDSYFQGISDLALDEEGLLEDWPQERAIAEGRTAAILSSVDAGGKAKILRFLSQSRLLSPIKRDRYLGRPIFDGVGGYAEDRAEGIRVVTLGVMLAGADLSGQDLRWTDLSDANMVRADLTNGDLVKANLARTILYEASLKGADLKGVKFFYGSVEKASPRSRSHPPDYDTGAYTGTVIEHINFTGVKNMSEEQRIYCCSWCGDKSRATIPGGCEGIPNRLGR
ncbi:MAG: hypothetical protein N5P05_000278 [Chroococcopsis gigantea SAG 12.99]|jgi:uncharacterized protein YjbI with pentapeptide repeats|nr:hypothetical protein [Chroococcopsis gigantea SAG 12.99]